MLCSIGLIIGIEFRVAAIEGASKYKAPFTTINNFDQLDSLLAYI